MVSSIELKFKLYEKCEEYIESKIANSKMALDLLKSTGEGDIKSSAGDKFETEIAMRHFEQEKFSNQLSDAMKLKKVLPLLHPDKTTPKVSLGSLVITNNGNFYISISAGKMLVGGKTYFALSGGSPVAKILEGGTPGMVVTINNKQVTILEVY